MDQLAQVGQGGMPAQGALMQVGQMEGVEVESEVA